MKKIEEFDLISLKETIDTLDNDHKTLCGKLLNELMFMQVTMDDLKKEIQEKESKIQDVMIEIKKKYGKNAILKGMNLEDGGTTIERNNQIGGHKA